MIVETLFSTRDPAGRPNFAPMGVIWGDEEIVVRPFHNTDTCRNLIATGYGVASVTDDVLAFVIGALGDADLAHFPAAAVPGVVFAGACYWRELALVPHQRAGPADQARSVAPGSARDRPDVVLLSAGGGPERAELRCRVVHRGWQRDFLGFNRARNAVLEAAILATRLHLLDPAVVAAELDRYEAIVIKTGDDPERTALNRVRDYVRCWHDETAG